MEDDFEATLIKTRIRNIKYLFRCVYRAPDESSKIFDCIEDKLRYATQNNYEIIILGDLNCGSLNASPKQTERPFEFLTANGLEQLIKKPTRVTKNSQSIIDILIALTPCLFKDAGVLTTALSDHYSVHGKAIRNNKHRIITTRSWDEVCIKNLVVGLQQAPWSVIETFDDANDMSSAWGLLMKSLFEQHFPLKRKRIQKRIRGCP